MKQHIIPIKRDSKKVEFIPPIPQDELQTTMRTIWDSSAKSRDLFIKSVRGILKDRIEISYTVLGRNYYLIEAKSQNPMAFYEMGLIAAQVIQVFRKK